MPDLTHLAFCDRIEPLILGFADVVDGADFTTPVPSCGDDWDLRDLVGHIGLLHRWVERMVREVSPTRIDRARAGIVVPEPAAMATWLRDGAAPLVAALRRCDPDAIMWAWGEDKHARFWSRRMVHETTVHRLDAELTLGRVTPLDARLAADGVDEFLANTVHTRIWAPSIADIKGDGEQIALHAVDTGASWTVTLVAHGYEWERAAATAPQARVDGTAEDLYLLLWSRRALGDGALHASGDTALLASFLEKLSEV